MAWVRWFIFCLLLMGLLGCASKSQQQQNKQQAEVHFKLGVSHLQANNPTMALKEFLLAVEQNPKDAEIQVALAQAYQLKKSYQNAERHYLQALELSPGTPRYQNNLASLYLAMEEWDKAADYFDKASNNLLFLNPHVSLTGKGYANYRKGDYPAALIAFQEAGALAPLYAPAHFYKSEVLRDLGQLEASRVALERAIELAPNYPEARYQLAILLLKDQRLEEATNEFQMVVNLAPQSEWGVKAAEFIKTLKKH